MVDEENEVLTQAEQGRRSGTEETLSSQAEGAPQTVEEDLRRKKA
jgi:hypothetical protein